MEERKSLEIRLTDLWTVLKRCWYLVLAVFVVVTIGLYVYMTQTRSPTYSSTAILYAGRDDVNSTSTQGVSVATTLVKDFTELIQSDAIVTAVREETGTLASPEELRRMVSISNPVNTRILYITVTAKDRASAQVLVNGFAKVACQKFNALFEVRDENGELLKEQTMLKLFSEGKYPERPNPVSMLRILIIAFVCAFLVYVGFLTIFLLDDKINNSDDVQRYLGISLLGEIPNRSDVRRKRSGYGYYTVDGKAPTSTLEQSERRPS